MKPRFVVVPLVPSHVPIVDEEEKKFEKFPRVARSSVANRFVVLPADPSHVPRVDEAENRLEKVFSPVQLFPSESRVDDAPEPGAPAEIQVPLMLKHPEVMSIPLEKVEVPSPRSMIEDVPTWKRPWTLSPPVNVDVPAPPTNSLPARDNILVGEVVPIPNAPMMVLVAVVLVASIASNTPRPATLSFAYGEVVPMPTLRANTTSPNIYVEVEKITPKSGFGVEDATLKRPKASIRTFSVNPTVGVFVLNTKSDAPAP